MWSFQGFESVFAGAKAGLSFLAGVQEAKAKRKWQAYNNAMTRIADAMNQGTINTNQNLAVERSTAQAFEIERTGYETEQSVIAAAAAADTEGNSVNQTIFQAQRNEARAQSRRQQDLEAQILGFDGQRRSSAFQAAQQIDYSPIPMPNPLVAMLGLGTDLMKIDQRYNDTDI